ncbi:hypothetical protein HK097_007125 [Rhizophlyctis rosea]|uniref:F-box domain-containing protein n=1 Tax=Rhizophlyctis rosea TaxID=64517 RepID=A0AAD5SLL8_9FUNG|nr:hypothetical protein HK097_007125 [Rhizophlyctis rosea]
MDAFPATPPPSPTSCITYPKCIYDIPDPQYNEVEHRLLSPPPEPVHRPPQRTKPFNLPAELLLHVLSFLPNKTDLIPLSQVSLAWNSCVWKKLFGSVEFKSVVAYRKFIDTLSIEKHLRETREKQPQARRYFNRPNAFFGHRIVTDAHISLFASSCPNLINVDLSYCRRVSDASIIRLVQSLPFLRSLSLCGTDITDATLNALLSARCTPNITHIDLSYCTALTEIPLQALVRALRSLQHINLSGLWRISEPFIRDLSVNCPRLKSLVVSDCRTVSQDLFASLRKYAKNLERLDISFCKGLNVEEMERYIKGNGTLKSCTYSATVGSSLELVHRVCDAALEDGCLA